jgi:hypothetical protein
MAQQFRTHQCAFIFDRGFCNGHILGLKKEEETALCFLIVDTSFVVVPHFFCFCARDSVLLGEAK